MEKNPLDYYVFDYEAWKMDQEDKVKRDAWKQRNHALNYDAGAATMIRDFQHYRLTYPCILPRPDEYVEVKGSPLPPLVDWDGKIEHVRGHPVRFICRDGLTYLVEVSIDGFNLVARFDHCGRHTVSKLQVIRNVAPITVRVQGWLNVYKNGKACFHNNTVEANSSCGNNRIACLWIDRNVIEGTGISE